MLHSHIFLLFSIYYAELRSMRWPQGFEIAEIIDGTYIKLEYKVANIC